MNSVGNRIDKIIKNSGLTQKVFAEKIGVSEQAIGNYINNRRFPKAEILLKMKQSFNVSVDWILTGKGDTLKDLQLKTADILDPNEYSRPIPLIPVDAFAGIGSNGGYSISDSTIEERYIIPLFDGKGVDFLISVRGSSMYPKYSSGDIVACRFVRELLFIQWNKVYVLDTKSQGSMIKRLIKSDNPKTVICRSDNKDYGDFEVPMDDIQNIALVIGAIRLE